jgi:hypothetical protein
VSPSATPSPSVSSKIDTSDDHTDNPSSPSVDNLTDRMQKKFSLNDFNSVSIVMQNEG